MSAVVPPATSAAPVSAPARPELDDKPPILGSWRNLYLLVFGVLVVLIVFFTVLTQVYA
jgi:hypothetical protein